MSTPGQKIPQDQKVPQDRKVTAELGLADTLAVQRTRMASERTLMGWVRTAISMISFGFTMAKALAVRGPGGGAEGNTSLHGRKRGGDPHRPGYGPH